MDRPSVLPGLDTRTHDGLGVGGHFCRSVFRGTRRVDDSEPLSSGELWVCFFLEPPDKRRKPRRATDGMQLSSSLSPVLCAHFAFLHPSLHPGPAPGQAGTWNLNSIISFSSFPGLTAMSPHPTSLLCVDALPKTLQRTIKEQAEGEQRHRLKASMLDSSCKHKTNNTLAQKIHLREGMTAANRVQHHWLFNACSKNRENVQQMCNVHLESSRIRFYLIDFKIKRPAMKKFLEWSHAHPALFKSC